MSRGLGRVQRDILNPGGHESLAAADPAGDPPPRFLQSRNPPPVQPKEHPAMTPDPPHLTGCPADDRIERYDARRPNGTTVVVVRCVQCGAHTVDGGPRRSRTAR